MRPMDTTAPSIAQAARLFQALSDETRLQIVHMLASGERCVCDLQDGVGSYQSRLSFHLRKLREAGIVSDRRDGRWVYYTLRPEALETMREFLSAAETGEAWSGCAPGSGCCG